MTVQLTVIRSGAQLAANTETLLATLPAGYWPDERMFITGYTHAVQPVHMWIDPNGQIKAYAYSADIANGRAVSPTVTTFPV